MVVVVGGLYVGGGWIANRRLKGLDGVDALPHADRWREFAGLARDGVRFTQARIHGQNGYKAVKRDWSDQIDADRETGTLGLMIGLTTRMTAPVGRLAAEVVARAATGEPSDHPKPQRTAAKGAAGAR